MRRRTVFPNFLGAPLYVFLLLAVQLPAQGQFVPGVQYYNQQGLATINALGAYNQGISGSGVTIGVVDSGLNPNHITLGNSVVAAMGWARTDPDNVMVNNWFSQTGTRNLSSFLNAMSADGTNVDGHGTFVTSIAAGRLNNITTPNNIMGAAYNAKVVFGQIVFEKKDEDGNLTGAGLSVNQIAETIDYVSAQPGVKVINNSWGSIFINSGQPVTMTEVMHANLPDASYDALKRAQDRGIVIVVAAGNDGMPFPMPPATLPSVDKAVMDKGGWIVVAATTNRGINPSTGQIEMARTNPNTSIGSFYTNFCGEAMLYCISAPGGLDAPGWPGNDGGIAGANALANTEYDRGNGTSYAAPLVTGAVALVASQFPWMTSKNLGVTILTTGSTAADPSLIWGRGLLDVGKAMNGPGIFEENFEANVTAGYRSTFSNDISGQAGLIKEGVGTLTLAGANSYSGTTQILNGTLGLSGRGSIAWSSAVLNAATFDLTAASTVVSLADTYTQTATGTLLMGIRPGQGQLLAVGGVATLAGTLNVQGTQGVYAPARLTLVSAASIASPFDSFESNLANYTSYKTYSSYGANNVYLNIVRPYAETVVEQGNVVSRGAAQSLYDVAGTPLSINGAMAAPLNALNNLNAPMQSVAIRQTLPVLLGGASQATYNTQRAFQQTIMARIDNIRGMESGEYFASDRKVWMKPFGNITSQGSLDNVPGYRATGGGLAVGLDHRLTDVTTLGGVFAYSYNALSASGDGSGTLGINAFQLGLYGAYALSGDTDLNYQVDLGLNQNREARAIGFMSTSSQAHYNSYTSHVGIGVKKVIPVTSALNAIPLLRLDYAAINADSYTESGAGALNLNVRSQTYQELMFTAGLKGDYQVSDHLKLTANAGVGYNALNQRVQIVASYTGGGNSFVTQGFNGSAWLYSAGVGVVAYAKEGVELSARYDVQATTTGFLNQMASIRLSMQY